MFSNSLTYIYTIYTNAINDRGIDENEVQLLINM